MSQPQFNKPSLNPRPLNPRTPVDPQDHALKNLKIERHWKKRPAASVAIKLKKGHE